MLDTRDLALVGTLQDPKALLGTVGFPGPVAYTIVNGKVVVKEGKLVNLDEAAFTTKANRLQQQFIGY